MAKFVASTTLGLTLQKAKYYGNEWHWQICSIKILALGQKHSAEQIY